MTKRSTHMTPGLFGFDVPVDGSAKASTDDRHKAWETGAEVNPMVVAHGRHLDHSLRCKDCNYLYYYNYSRRYYKCNFEKETRGPLADHHKHWPACTKLEPYDNKQSHEIIS